MNKILVANRGEIALRIMKTIRKMGLKSVAVYSDVDEYMPYVQYADEKAYLGKPQPSESYLNIDKILNICIEYKVDAVHPGYGFLSENSVFAQKLNDSNIRFIGPSVESIHLMGDKILSKKTVSKYNVPLIDGTKNAINSLEEAIQIAQTISYPILIKASAGGGGKGMRIVTCEEELEENMNRAISEAITSFGNGEIFIEKYVESPKHIEIQILADKLGNIVYLFDRECSVQRRHQKVVEEAPSISINDEIRNKMGETACNVARSCNYVGAGTVEFLLDKNKNFYFLEMNTRLQVEHPVTEMITGIDIVEQQIKIEIGEKLEFTQKDLKINGHSLEIRIYAEDSLNNFAPDIGNLEIYSIPKLSNVRVDDAYCQGMNIPIHYDPMISKLICHADNRQDAVKLMNTAIDEYKIYPVKTSLNLCKFIINHPKFIDGSFDTNFISNYFDAMTINQMDEIECVTAALIAYELEENNYENTIIKYKKETAKVFIN